MNQNNNTSGLKFVVMATSNEKRSFVVTPVGAKRISESKSNPAMAKEIEERAEDFVRNNLSNSGTVKTLKRKK